VEIEFFMSRIVDLVIDFTFNIGAQKIPRKDCREQNAKDAELKKIKIKNACHSRENGNPVFSDKERDGVCILYLINIIFLISLSTPSTHIFMKYIPDDNS